VATLLCQDYPTLEPLSAALQCSFDESVSAGVRSKTKNFGVQTKNLQVGTYATQHTTHSMAKTSREYRKWSKLTYEDRALNVPLKCPEFKHAMEKFPDAEFERNKRVVEAVQSMNDAELKLMLVGNRWRNGLCSHCHFKDYTTRDKSLWHCKGCHLVYYCSKTCQRADWEKHRSFCQQGAQCTDLPEKCPYMVALVHVPDIGEPPIGQIGLLGTIRK
jgi:hypothetical protein